MATTEPTPEDILGTDATEPELQPKAAPDQLKASELEPQIDAMLAGSRTRRDGWYRHRAFWIGLLCLVIVSLVTWAFMSTMNMESSSRQQTETTQSASTPITNAPSQQAAEPVHAEVALNHIPLGDGKVSSTEGKVGYVYQCDTPRNVGGAEHAGDWLKSDYWDSTTKPTVDGDVAWSTARYAATKQGESRVLSGNSLPLDHHTGVFPIARTDDAYQYDRNPNAISAQSESYSVPAMPAVASRESCVNMGVIGFMNSGVALYNALDAAGRDAAAHEVQDKCDGHPQQQGEYHYHNLSRCVADVKAGAHSSLLGYALDGFGIYGNYGEKGESLTNADLDVCHGHTHEITWDGKKTKMYHYHTTREYPYTLGCYKGTPVAVKAQRQ